VNVALPAFAAARRAAAPYRCTTPAVQQSIDIVYPPGPQQQTRRTLLQRRANEWDRQTDGRTPCRIIIYVPCGQCANKGMKVKQKRYAQK